MVHRPRGARLVPATGAWTAARLYAGYCKAAVAGRVSTRQLIHAAAGQDPPYNPSRNFPSTKIGKAATIESMRSNTPP